MSCIHITACQLACLPSALPAQTSQLNKASACTSAYLGTKLPKISSMKLSSATSKYKQCAIVCLFGGKGKSGNGNEASPWDALGKAMGNFKKDPSIEDVLKQQIQKQEYYDDGGSGGKPPGGGGLGGGGFGEAEDESLSGMWNEFSQVILATFGFVFLYIYIIEGEEITVIAKDFLKFLFKRQKSIRLTRLMNQWKSFFERMKEKEDYDPYWLEREIINTPTLYDNPAKYRYIIDALESRSDSDDD
ncbi:hypothetical protein BUALT_Bualt03G0027500 [Buddleja alternifolia]|uniref:Uncharacterized protein n=1 Tax=Buddleja alternifolia TaxID=168488 RepID=A0AAV6XRZ2_9LAMI|nr:hypothetical protein BUALT_Bualt03G0027500 [Buddleja alternifolia]